MPPTSTKRKASAQGSRETKAQTKEAPAKLEQVNYAWILTFTHTRHSWGKTFDDGKDVLPMVFTTKEKAMAAMPKMMDSNRKCGSSWRNGLKGFGRHKNENEYGFKYCDDLIGEEGGVLIHNHHSDNSAKISISLRRVTLDPPDAGFELPQEAEKDEETEDEYNGSKFRKSVFKNGRFN